MNAVTIVCAAIIGWFALAFTVCAVLIVLGERRWRRCGPHCPAYRPSPAAGVAAICLAADLRPSAPTGGRCLLQKR